MHVQYCFDLLMLINSDIFLVVVTIFSLLLLYEIGIYLWKFEKKNYSVGGK
jgi:hypothetical protein